MKTIYYPLSILLILAGFLLTDCKKKKEDPKPTTPACTTPATPVITGYNETPEGGTMTLTTAAVANASYQWTGPNGFSSSNDSVIIANFSAANAGTYSLTVNVSGCTSAAGTFLVNVGPACGVGDNTSTFTNGSTEFLQSVSNSTLPNGNYALTSTFTSRVITIEFGTTTEPASGIYNVNAGASGALAANEVRVLVTFNSGSPSGTYQATDSRVFVVKTGTQTATTLCPATFSPVSGGVSISGSARMIRP
ncbi:MAG: hypothetical protein K0S33_3029 [Bacteroidetes bacterium]|jgi:hypothetical protein|nr:hypothetical protein [Bacteroidota bacterium]